MNETEIKRMVNDAKAHESEDKEKKRKVEIRNQADDALFQSEKQMRDLGDKLSAETRAKLEAAAARVREALKGDNLSETESATNALNQVWHEASAEMYKSASGSNGNGQQYQRTSPTDSPTGDSKPVDAEFEEVKE